MKKTLPVLLLGVYLLAFLQPIVPLCSYLINYDYYANVLCVNRSQPQLKCNGKCHLAKEISASTSDPEAAIKNEIQLPSVFPHTPNVAESSPIDPTLQTSATFYLCCMRSTDFVERIPHPPKV